MVRTPNQRAVETVALGHPGTGPMALRHQGPALHPRRDLRGSRAGSRDLGRSEMAEGVLRPVQLALGATDRSSSAAADTMVSANMYGQLGVIVSANVQVR